MVYKKLGTTDLSISQICLGSMNWGQQNDEQDAHTQLDYAVSQGVNIIDTAELYPVPPTEETQGKTEQYIGTWLKNKKREDVIIASKVIGRSDMTYFRNGEETRLTKQQISYAVEQSLTRLQTDYIDLYQLHWPDRLTNFFGRRGYNAVAREDTIPLEETLSALSDLVKEGKIRYIGLSNETAWGVTEFLRLSREKGYPRIQSIQNPYNLIMREYEIALSEITLHENVSLLVYSPLAMGVLTGKYLHGQYPKGSRFEFSKRNVDRYNPPEAQTAIELYINLAKKYGLNPAQMALAFVHSQPFVTSTIIGATNVEQLKTNIESAQIKLTEDLLNEIETIHKMHPNPIS